MPLNWKLAPYPSRPCLPRSTFTFRMDPKIYFPTLITKLEELVPPPFFVVEMPSMPSGESRQMQQCPLSYHRRNQLLQLNVLASLRVSDTVVSLKFKLGGKSLDPKKQNKIKIIRFGRLVYGVKWP